MIYFIQTILPNGKGPIKIGYTTDSAERRIAALQEGSPFELKVLLQMEGSAKIEKQLHYNFRDLRIVGEWYKCEPDLLNFIKTPEVGILHPVPPDHRPDE